MCTGAWQTIDAGKRLRFAGDMAHTYRNSSDQTVLFSLLTITRVIKRENYFVSLRLTTIKPPFRYRYWIRKTICQQATSLISELLSPARDAAIAAKRFCMVQMPPISA